VGDKTEKLFPGPMNLFQVLACNKFAAQIKNPKAVEIMGSYWEC